MATSYYLVLLLLIAASASLPANCNLSKHHYRSSCPEALSIVQAGVKAAVKNETRTAASLLRLHFYDCFVNACNFKSLHTCSHLFVFALVPIHNSSGGFNAVDDIKAKMEKEHAQLGGPSWKVRLERRDSTTVSRTAANTSIRRPTSNLSALISNFMGSLIEAHGQELFNGNSANSLVKRYADDISVFVKDFPRATIKMGNISPLTGSAGQIRINCRKVN
ncbi:peroxidase 2 [Citrus sinensis]|nr:peroxidase 2 [Citrus sinensis]